MSKMFKQYYCLVFLCVIYNTEFVYAISIKPYVNETKIAPNVTASGNKTEIKTTIEIGTEGGQIKVGENRTKVDDIKSLNSSTMLPKPKEAPVVDNTSKNSSTVPAIHSSTAPAVQKQSTPVEYYGDSKIKPRKGVNMSESGEAEPVKSSSTPSSTTFIPRKPTVTIGSDDEPSSFKVNKISHAKHDEAVLGNVPLRKEPDYVLPIVLSILAVPLVAILLAVIYKRGAEWWHHRHYRRMDFLIDGMYNN